MIRINKNKNRKKIIAYLKDFFKKKAQCYEVEMAFLYGSWARGTPRQDSDLDIAVLFSAEDLSEHKSFQYITDISLALSQELGLEVNIILIHWDFRLPMLYYNAIVLGDPVFIKYDTGFINLKNMAIAQMEDFSIFGRDWQLQLARKNLEELEHA